MDWIDDLTNWLREQLQSLWDGFVEFMTDFIVMMIEGATDTVLAIIDLLPVPDFLATYSLCALLNAAGPEVGYFLQTFRIAEGLALLAAGYGFRLLRKLLTLFQW